MLATCLVHVPSIWTSTIWFSSKWRLRCFIYLYLYYVAIGRSKSNNRRINMNLCGVLPTLFRFCSSMARWIYTPELLSTFSYMKCSNFDNPIFEFIRDKAFGVFNFIKYSIPSEFGSLGYSSISVIVNFMDKLIMILLFLLVVFVIYIIYKLLNNRSNKFVNFIKRKDIELRYEGLTRFFMEILLNMFIVNLINMSYGKFKDSFDIISYTVSIILTLVIFYMVIYCFAYPAVYYSELLTHPEIHERHWLLFLEFNKENPINLRFYSYFIIHRYFFAFIIVWMYNYPAQQWVLLWFLNLLMLIYTFKVYESWLQNFLHTFNWVILIVFSILVWLFLKSDDPTKLMIWGYVSISYFLTPHYSYLFVKQKNGF